MEWNHLIADARRLAEDCGKFPNNEISRLDGCKVLCRLALRKSAAAADIGFDQELRIVLDQRAIDLDVLQDALHVIARL